MDSKLMVEGSKLRLVSEIGQDRLHLVGIWGENGLLLGKREEDLILDLQATNTEEGGRESMESMIVMNTEGGSIQDLDRKIVINLKNAVTLGIAIGLPVNTDIDTQIQKN